MPTFAYTGRTRGGQTVSGERVADSMDAATAALRRDQINVTRITPAKAKPEEKKAKDATAAEAATWRRPGRSLHRQPGGGVYHSPR